MSLFTDHPASVGETYAQHLGSASFFGSRMILAGLACMLHGRMVVNRHRQPAPTGVRAGLSGRAAA